MGYVLFGILGTILRRSANRHISFGVAGPEEKRGFPVYAETITDAELGKMVKKILSMCE